MPLLVEYTLSENSYLRFYLAPKVRHVYLLLRSARANECRSATRSKQFVMFSDVFSGFMWEDSRRTVHVCLRFAYGALWYHLHVLVESTRVRFGEWATHAYPQRAPRLCPTTERPTSLRAEFQIRNTTYSHTVLCIPRAAVDFPFCSAELLHNLT